MDPQRSTDRTLGVHDFCMYEMKESKLLKAVPGFINPIGTDVPIVIGLLLH